MEIFTSTETEMYKTANLTFQNQIQNYSMDNLQNVVKTLADNLCRLKYC